MVETFINDYFVTVAGSGITSGGLTLTVSTAASAASGFRILIGSELMQVTAGGTTTSWTVSRGMESTTATAHNYGDVIHVVVTAASLNTLTPNSSIGTYALLPGSGMKAGDRYQCTDAPYSFVYDGSNWIPFAFGKRVYIPTGSWAWKAQGSNLTLDATKGMYAFTITSSGSSPESSVYWKATPSTPYKVHAIIQVCSAGGSSGSYGNLLTGLFVGENSGGTGTMWTSRLQGELDSFNVTAGNNNYSGILAPGVGGLAQGAINGGLLHLAIEDNGTTKIFGVHDGYGNISQAFTRGHTQDVTPDHIGFYVSDTGFSAIMNLISWHEF